MDTVAKAIAPVDWAQARAALAEVVPRVTAILRSWPDPSAPALGQWTLAEVATHLSQALAEVPRLHRAERDSPLTGVWDLATFTTSMVSAEPERDLRVLADRIDASAADFLSRVAGADPDAAGPWLVEGTSLPLRSFVCHLLNESIVHGWDIARAAGRPWPIERSHALLVLQGFLVPVLATLDSRAMVDQQKAATLKATYDIRFRGGGRVFFVFENGALRLETPSQRRVQCHLSADPAAMLLVVWGRTSQWPVIAKGRLMAWGTRPWLGLRLRSFMRNP